MTGETLSQYLYHSILADEHDASCVGSIIKAARAFNATHGITGILLFDGERFLQYIEGAPPEIDALAARISKDGRHKAVKPLLHAPLAGLRRYPIWSMAYSDLDTDAIIDEMLTKGPHEALEILKDRHQALDIG